MEYKAPGTAVANFTQDWSGWLGSDTISVSSWTVDSALTVDSHTKTTTLTNAYISGGVAGTTYKVENEMTSASGLKSTQIWFLRVQEQIV